MPEEKDSPDPSANEAAEAPPREGATKQFSLKVESWMSDVAGDFAPADAPPASLAAVTLEAEPVKPPEAAPLLADPLAAEPATASAAPSVPESPATRDLAGPRKKRAGRGRAVIMALLILAIGVEAWLSWGASLRTRIGL